MKIFVAVLFVLVVILGVSVVTKRKATPKIDTSMETKRVRGAITGKETVPILNALRKFDVMLVRHENEVSELRQIEGLKKSTSAEMRGLLSTHKDERNALRTKFEYDLYIYIHNGKEGLSWQHLSAHAKNKIEHDKALT